MSEEKQERPYTVWVIEPHDPLIFRDGRPFSVKPGIIAHSLPFPFPATTAGGVRTQAGLNEQGVFVVTSNEQLEALKKLKVRGPFLVQMRSHDEKQAEEEKEALDWFVPAPADAWLLKSDEEAVPQIKARVKLLVPVNTNDALTDLEGFCQEKKIEPVLQLVGMQQWVSGKPVEKPPHYWRWDVFCQWLLSPGEKDIYTWSDLGIMGPMQEQRVHVSMDGANHQGKDGALFATRGMEFVAFNDKEGLSQASPLALALVMEANAQPTPREGFTSFGAERRVVRWRKYTSRALACPSDLIDKIVVDEQKRWPCRMILLTPACFDRGFYPTSLLQEQDGVRPTLKAIAVQRPEVISGWDMVKRKEKKSRRLAPAGTVFFLELEGEQEKVKAWVKKHWLQCVSDQEPDCNDGFGVAVIGTWDRQPQEMQSGEEV